VCGSARKRGYNRFKFIEYTFFYYYYYYFYIFTPVDISRSPCVTGKSSSCLSPFRGHTVAKIRRRAVRHVSIFVPKLDYYFSDFVSTRFEFTGILRYFLFIALVEIRIKQAQRSRTVRLHDGQLQCFPVCCNTRCTHSGSIINLHTIISSCVYYIILYLYMCVVRAYDTCYGTYTNTIRT